MSDALGSLAQGWSLEQRIRRRLLVAFASLWVLSSAVALYVVEDETAEVLDSALQEVGQRLLVLPESALRDGEQDALFMAIGTHEESVVYQVYGPAGTMDLHSHQAPATPLDPDTRDGFRDVRGWHVLTLNRSDGKRRIQVAETRKHRVQLFSRILFWLVGSLAFVLPLASVALAVILRQGFHALAPAHAELSGRSADDRRPLSTEGAPDELQPWLASVNGLIARVGSLVDMERIAAAETAHELRTPLAAARAQAQRLLDVTTEETARRHAEALVRQLDRLTRVATRLLQVARIESGATLRREPVDLVVVARLVVEEFPEAIGSERLRIEVSGHPAEVVGDIDAIAVALRNLIENALKHGGKDAWVTVLVEDGAIYVVDDGPGVPAEMLGKLVRPFERGITAAAGSGLGLAITNAIARQGGALLELRSPIVGNRGFAAILRF